MEFVEAAKALGYKHGRIIFKHILPNVMGTLAFMLVGNGLRDALDTRNITAR